MGFFSNIFKGLFAPVDQVASVVNTVVNGATNLVDTVGHGVSDILDPIPVLGDIADEFDFQIDNATDLIDNVGSMVTGTVGNVGQIGGSLLDLNLGDTGLWLGDTIENQVGSSVGFVFTTLGNAIESLFDFG